MELKLKGGEVYEVDAVDIRMWQQQFPRLDVEQLSRNMAAWCDANPKKRKTMRGARKFIVAWLMREAGKQPKVGGSYAASHKMFEKDAPKKITREGGEKGLAMLRQAKAGLRR